MKWNCININHPHENELKCDLLTWKSKTLLSMYFANWNWWYVDISTIQSRLWQVRNSPPCLPLYPTRQSLPCGKLRKRVESAVNVTSGFRGVITSITLLSGQDEISEPTRSGKLWRRVDRQELDGRRCHINMVWGRVTLPYLIRKSTLFTFPHINHQRQMIII